MLARDGGSGSLAGSQEARVAQAVRAAVPAARLDKVRCGAGGSVSARRSNVARVQVCSSAGYWPRDFKGVRTEAVDATISQLSWVKSLGQEELGNRQKGRELPQLLRAWFGSVLKGKFGCVVAPAGQEPDKVNLELLGSGPVTKVLANGVRAQRMVPCWAVAARGNQEV